MPRSPKPKRKARAKKKILVGQIYPTKDYPVLKPRKGPFLGFNESAC